MDPYNGFENMVKRIKQYDDVDYISAEDKKELGEYWKQASTEEREQIVESIVQRVSECQETSLEDFRKDMKYFKEEQISTNACTADRCGEVTDFESRAQLITEVSHRIMDREIEQINEVMKDAEVTEAEATSNNKAPEQAKNLNARITVASF